MVWSSWTQEQKASASRVWDTANPPLRQGERKREAARFGRQPPGRQEPSGSNSHATRTELDFGPSREGAASRSTFGWPPRRETEVCSRSLAVTWQQAPSERTERTPDSAPGHVRQEAHGSIGRTSVGNGTGPQRTLQRSKALRSRAPDRSATVRQRASAKTARERRREGTNRGEQDFGPGDEGRLLRREKLRRVWRFREWWPASASDLQLDEPHDRLRGATNSLGTVRSKPPKS